MADDEGRFRAPASAILGHVFPYDEDAPRKLRGWVSEIKASGMIVFYVDQGIPYGAFRHWRRHQKINRPSPSLLPPPPDHEVVTENSVDAHGNGSELSVKDHGSITIDALSHAQARVPIRSLTTETSQGEEQNHARSEQLRLSHKLASNILAADPNAAVAPESKGWLDAMRLLAERDGRSLALIERVIDWLTTDHRDAQFWSTVVLSAPTLRKRFTQVVAKMNGSQPSHVSSRDRVVADQNSYLKYYPDEGAA